MTNEEDKPKIIVDDDWKTRAQAEKEQLQKQAEMKAAQEQGTAPAEATQTAAPIQAEPSDAESPEADMPLPPPTFSVLISSLATQALAMLGQIPLEDGKPIVRLDHAKHYIDTLSMLEEKTKGNLDGSEMVMINNVLHDLRMAYVQATKTPTE